MIVDLERNDLGRICRIGSVKVIEPRTIETHPTVYHGAATIAGILRDNISLVDLLAATFPGGSITGAPKIRAMQIIDELEPLRRGPYCGAIGYLDATGLIQFNIVIRTMVLRDGLAHLSVGGGIVADSLPELEYDETLVKALRPAPRAFNCRRDPQAARFSGSQLRAASVRTLCMTRPPSTVILSASEGSGPFLSQLARYSSHTHKPLRRFHLPSPCIMSVSER